MTGRSQFVAARARRLVWLALLLPMAAWATPPAHAPAHGWRKQHDPEYLGYTGKKWDRDYGILAGTCHREAVGAVLGGVVGGAIGSQVGKGDGNKVAIIVGTALGAVLGAKIGRDMDRADAACIGHALELAKDGQRVSWRDDAGREFRLKPLKGFSEGRLPCRTFELTVGGKTSRQHACETGPGNWELR